jgi:sodium transport system permease protein
MLYHYEGEMKSGLGASAVERFFRDLREKTVETRLADRGLSAEVVKPFEVKRQNVAPPEKVGGNIIGGLIPYIIIILCFTGAMYPAIDLTAGEKERGTMETLLCSPVHRVNIVLGKFLMVMTASIATMCLTLISTGVSLAIGGSFFTGGGRAATAASAAGGAAKAAANVMPAIDPVGILGVFALIAPVAVLFAAVLLTISLFAKSYKEAQSYVSPLIMVVIMPAMLGMLPGIELTAKTALVPILNLSLACKEMLSGVWHWPYLGLIFGSTCAYAAVALALCVKMFNREEVMFRE